MQEGEVIHFAEQDGISLIIYHVKVMPSHKIKRVQYSSSVGKASRYRYTLALAHSFALRN